MEIIQGCSWSSQVAKSFVGKCPETCEDTLLDIVVAIWKPTRRPCHSDAERKCCEESPRGHLTRQIRHDSIHICPAETCQEEFTFFTWLSVIWQCLYRFRVIEHLLGLVAMGAKPSQAGAEIAPRSCQTVACAKRFGILGAQNQKKFPPRMVSDQIAYKLKRVKEHFFSPNFFWIQYDLLLLHRRVNPLTV